MTIAASPFVDRAFELQKSLGSFHAFAPLPRTMSVSRPSTGYDDVKQVALARMVVGNIPSIQVDWALYGPKLAQVALTVGADDVDNVAAADPGHPRHAAKSVRRDQGQHQGSGVGAGRARRVVPRAFMTPIRLGAVAYLNARPLVHGLEQRSDLFTLEFDPPSRCAVRLHEHSIDVGMIPTIEYCRGPEYRIVPGIGIVSDGPVASVALFTRKPLDTIATIAADTSSRTSNALLRILCAERFGIAPEFRPMLPTPTAC